MSSIIKQSNISDKSYRRLLEIKNITFSQQMTYEQEEVPEVNPSDILEDAQKEARVLREQIKKEYEEHQLQMAREVELFKKQCVTDKEAAFQKGYEEGYEMGENDAKEAYSNLIQQAQHLIDLSQDDYNKYIESAEYDIVSLATEVARTIIDDTVQEDHEKWLSFVRKAIQEARDQETITLTVDPSWFEITRQYKQDLENVTYGAKLVIYPNEKRPPNSCLIETPFGQIDASLDSQLIEMKRKLIELLEQGYDDNESS